MTSPFPATPAPGRRRRRAVALAVTLLAAAAAVEAQRLQVATFSMDDGLPSAEIVDLAQDATGRLWVLTADGLMVYDGQTWTPAPRQGLPAFELGAIEIDAAGQPWVVTRLSGPLVYRLEGAEWRALPRPDSQIRHQFGVTSFLVRAGEPPKVAVGSAGDGLWLWDGGRSEGWTHLGTASGLPSDLVPALALFENATAVATGKGLCLLDDGGLDCTLRRREPRLADRLLALFADASRLWILASTWLGYLEDGRLTVVADHLPLATTPEPTRGSLNVDAAGGITFGLYQMALYRDPEGRISTLGTAEGLHGYGVTALLTDRESNLWIGSARGLSQIVSRRFVSFGKSEGLLDDEVTALAEPVPDRFVFGHNKRLTLVGAESTTLPFGEPSSPDGYRVMDMATDHGTVWIAANSMGLLRLDGDRLRHVPLAETLISSVELDDHGTVWVTGQRKLFAGDGTAFSEVDHGHADTGYLRWLAIGPEGNVYISTNRGLLWRDRTVWRRSMAAMNEANVLYGLLAQRSGELWAGTRAGLYELRGDELVKVRRGELEIDDPVYSIVRDDRRRIWFGTDDGVRVWDGRRLRHLTLRHGLAGRETNRGAALVDHRGKVWIGTDRGVSRYEDAYDLPPAAAPTLEIVSLEAGGARRRVDAPVELGSRQDDLTFHLHAIALSRQEPILVRYQLEGHDAGWQGPVPLPADGIRYTGVGPGSLRFRAAAGWAGGGPWGGEVVSAAVVVARPPWQRPGVLALGAAGLGLVLLGVYSLRTRAVGRRNVELEAMNARLNRYVSERQGLIAELESRNAELERFTYTVSHDLKSPLVTIRGFLGLLERDAAAGDVAKLRRDVEHIDAAAAGQVRGWLFHRETNGLEVAVSTAGGRLYFDERLFVAWLFGRNR